jgi:hypothetical protein
MNSISLGEWKLLVPSSNLGIISWYLLWGPNDLLFYLQYFDLLNIFELNGLPSEDNPYLFNGDFVDRGSFSLEIILTLFAFKCLYPTGKYLQFSFCSRS